MTALDLPQVTRAGVGLAGAAVAAGVLLDLLVRLLVRTVMRWRGKGGAATTAFPRLAFWLIVAVGEHAATIVAMGLTSTSIRTVDGRLVLIPNSVMHSRTR